MKELTPQALTVLEKRYLRKDAQGQLIEKPADMFWRVAEALGADSKQTEDFYYLMSSLDFLPNSPTLMNAGTGAGSLSACFVIPVEDSMEGITKASHDAAMVQKYGGGTGFSLSRIRPKGAGISTTHGAACGPVAVLKYLSATSTLVTQGGKRDGANMGILRVDHPDIREFIHCKDASVAGNAGDTLHNFNISVGITDEFMAAVRNDEVFDLKFNGFYYDAIDARGLWQEIIESAHKTGDPGVVFLDRINNGAANPVPSLGPIEATNPCLSGDTLIATVHEGHKTFAELAERGTDVLVYAWSPETKRPVVRWMRKPRLTRANVPVLAVEFDSGLKVRCTPDHNFYSFRGEKVQAQNLRVGQSVRAYSTSIHRDGHLRAHGWDGVNNKATHQWVARMVWECEKGELFSSDVVHHLNHNQRDNRIENLGITDPISHNAHHYPQRYENGFRTVGPLKDSTKQKISERLKGHPACIESGKRVAEWNRQNRWVQSAANHKVVAVYPDGEADVYNGTVDDVHTYIVVDPQYQGTAPNTAFTGIVSANCGEQPLYPYDSCNLGSLNLGNFVKDDHTFDFERLKKATQVAVRLLDRVVSVNTFPLQEVSDLNEKIRRIGLGVMGWHDALIKMRIPYVSEEAVNLGRKVMYLISIHGFGESARLAEELGPFPLFEDSIWADGQPLRNSTITTIAPTGTISLIAGASSGIEPVFAWEYKHNGLEGRIKETVKHPLYQQALDEGWYTPELFQSAMEIAPEWHLKHQAAFQDHTDNAVSKTINLPQSATVEDVKRCYEMAWDLGCKGVTIYRDGSKGSQVLETVKPVDASGPEPGMTYNRNFNGHNFPDDLSKCLACGDSYPFSGGRACPGVQRLWEHLRPEILAAVSIKQPTPFGTAYLTITEDNGQPLELFATLGKAGSDVAGMLEAMCRVVSKQLRAANPEERRGILTSVRDQWAGIGGATTSGFGPSKVKSLPDALSRALGRYLECSSCVVAGEAPVGPVVAPQEVMGVTGGFPLLDICPDCQNYTLQHGEGCAKCLDCGYSKC